MEQVVPRETLIDQYKRLSPAARHLVQLGALHYSPINRTRLMELSHHSGWVDSQARALAYGETKATIDELLKRKILVQWPGRGLCVEQDLQDLAVQETVREGCFERYAAVIQRVSPRENGDFWVRYSDRFARDLRIAFYRNDVESYLQLLGSRSDHWRPIPVLQPFALDIFERLDPRLKQRFLTEAVQEAIRFARGSHEVLDAVAQVGATLEALDDEFISGWLDLLVARGDLEGLHRMDRRFGGALTEIAGCASFLRGEFAAAEAAFDAALIRIRKATRKRKVAIEHFPSLFHVCLLLKKNSPAERERARSIIATALNRWSSYAEMMGPLEGAIAFQESSGVDPWVFRNASPENPPLYNWTLGLLWSWFLREAKPPLDVSSVRPAIRNYGALGFDWLRAEMTALMERIEGNDPTQQRDGIVTLTDWLQPDPPWLRSLKAMTELGETHSPTQTTPGAAAAERLIWELDYDAEEGWLNLQPLLQKATKRGGWTKGRAVSLKRLYEANTSETLSCLTDEDRKICRCLTVNRSYRYYGRYLQEAYKFDIETTVLAMVGHPRIFRPNERRTPIEVVRQEPELVVTRNEAGGIDIALHPELGEAECVIREDGPYRLVVTAFTKQQQSLSGILGRSLTVPHEANDHVLHTIRSLASIVSVHSQIGDGVDTSQVVVADPRPHLHLTPFHAGVRAEFFVRPFGESGPFYRAGEGGENVFTRINDQSQTARRNLAEELQRQEEVFASCPSILRQDESFDDPLVFPTPPDALELMLELKPLVTSERVILHWPQGERFRLAGEADVSRFRVRIRQDHDWFAASGSLQIAEDESLELAQLAKLVDGAQSRFIQLDDGRYLALTDQLRRCVKDMASFGETRKNEIRFPTIRAAVFESLADLPSIETDHHWTETMQRMHAACGLDPEPPSTLQTELRDYQKEGHTWLRRLAAWGVGACLADDMGLGKTVQAIAVLLDRAQDGPALVVAPASVGFNWESEIYHFAPVLQPKLLGPSDRDAFFQELGPHHVVITSYGLLHTAAERFQAVHWHTVILDEAQAIKNMETKRSQAAMGLDADYRVVMTGTPMENHLGELWNLFQFINPGLLGSLEQFQRKFAIPIERDKHREARARLKRLIQPFILRRTKTEVLDELPSRTEVTLHVQLSAEEAAFYEALRRQAVDKLAQDNPAKPGAQHLRILAELMRLRRACCHPRLVWPESTLPGSKLALFNETIDNLMENRHKVLVFSQFVDHLSILRKELERKGVAYQYLDGSTPARERKHRVEAFQAGEGGVFLISLRAGGTGLNLTAADYVIHMDPWWNPAVEDQASDRAHRIGQERPVTIYRLVTEGTIEEKIVELHKSKRDLADSLLEGADLSGKLSAQDLLNLLRQGA